MIKIDIEYVKSVALEAGQRAVAMLDGRQAELKADGSYVTNIDRDTENFVRGRLEERYPDFAFLGEEFGRHGSDTAPLWAVDPIDGTTNLVFGIPQWGVSIGLIHEGESAAGVFFMPRTEETVSGPCGVGGAWCNGLPLHATDRTSIHAEDTLGFHECGNQKISIRRFLAGRPAVHGQHCGGHRVHGAWHILQPDWNARGRV